MPLFRWNSMMRIIRSDRIFRFSASTLSNPRSMKMLSLPRTRLSFPLMPSLLNKLPESSARQLDVRPRSLARLLLKRMQHVYRLHKLRHVNHPKRTADTDANFVHAKAYRRHRLPVRRFLAHLHEPELNTGLVPRLRGKVPNPPEAVAQPDNLL